MSSGSGSGPILVVLLAALMLSGGLGPAVAATGSQGAGVGSSSPGPKVTYAGSASGLWASWLFPQPFGPASYLDSGNLSEGGGETAAPPAAIHDLVAAGEGLLSIATGSEGKAEGQAAVGYLDLLHGTPSEVRASFVMAASFSSCSGASGKSQIADLEVGGRAVQVTGAPDQVVTLAGLLRLTINEQIASRDGMTVNALHLQTTLGTEVIVASAYSAVSCANSGFDADQSQAVPDFHPAQPCSGFLTGGGWINSAAVPTTKSTFGFVAGFMSEVALGGNLEFHDHSLGYDISATDVLYYVCGAHTGSREFGGEAEINRASGYCYDVLVRADGGQGNGSESLTVTVWGPTPSPCPTNGPPRSGSEGLYPRFYSESNFLGGGSIEIHDGASS
jgi:hypothetical protein